MPGIYSLNGSSFEEKVAIDYIKSYDKTIFLFIDGTNIKKGLFLYFEIKKYTNDIVLVITMKDIIEKNGVIIDIEKLEKILGSDVFLVDATSGIDTEKMFEKIEHSVPLKMIDNRYVEFNNERKFGYIHGVCDQIAYEVTNKTYEPNEKIKIIDKVILNRYFGVPVLIVLSLIIFGFVISFCGVLQQYLFNSFSIVIK